MNADSFEMLARLLAALAAGALIGYERSFHGRPAGFRTHALVCTASSLLMMVTVYEAHWMRQATGLVQIDPTRMAQGIMTGIGFLGAGVIIKEGLTVRGLTTAASIWITSAIGILAGIGFYFPLVVSVVLTLGVLSFFRWIEARMPSHAYYFFAVRFARSPGMSERQLRELVESHGFSIANFSYRMEGPERVRRHNMVIRSADRSSAGRLAVTLEGTESVLEFRITPTGD
ncbi:MAG TPA: MgtC/SapB family protein [Burkholderiales bacterium]|nr:MgtC/SapB family protein [Burkholderiales bacterium]